MPNALANAVSPYLRQHADNPVNWLPWGEDAFAEAVRRDVPVLVSIGYSTCHWCHVMARESFSDPATAAQLNEGFVAIKVDREEHPEVDAAYLSAASAFTRSLGWPLNVFVTPQGRAFFAGTYWPPRTVTGSASFRDVLSAVSEAWAERRDGVLATADSLAEALAETAQTMATTDAAAGPAPGASPDQLDAAVTAISSQEDREFGGFGTEPKFPMVPVLGFLLSRDSGRDLARRTIARMADSELRDSVDGGFFRYATRRDWSEPHYERMLYDNAGLLAAAALADEVTTAVEVARFLLEILRLPSGVFASAQDSESTIDGERSEGGYFRLDALGREGLTPPALDEKVITGWNGLAIEALTIAGVRLGRPELIEAAVTASDWLLKHHVREDGSLVHASLGGAGSESKATLADHGLLATGLLTLASATGLVRFAVAARELVGATRTARGPSGSAFEEEPPFAVAPDPVLAAQGLTLAADPSEGDLPSGSSAIARAAILLHALTGEVSYREDAERILAPLLPLALAQPTAFGATLTALGSLASPPRQLVVVSDAKKGALREFASRRFGESTITAIVTSAEAREFASAGFSLFEARTMIQGRPTAYLCEGFTCRVPVTSARQLAEQLNPEQLNPE